MLQELIKAFSLIFVAEMGDKTQILAMAFATRFPVKKVLLGIFMGSSLNHGLAILLGSYLSNFVPINTIQIVAGVAFVAFSLWTLNPEGEDEESTDQKIKLGPVFTVAMAFFIGELGDKTQLTAITLSTDAKYPLAILGGTVLGMLVTGGIGIIVGKKLGDKIPEFAIKIVASAVFMFFGVSKLLNTLPVQYLKPQYIIAFFAVITVIVFILMRKLVLQRRQGKESKLIKRSRELYNYYNQLKADMDKVCLGQGVCGECQGDKCLVGFTKSIVRNELDKRDEDDFKELMQKSFIINEQTFSKEYDKEQIIDSLSVTLKLLKNTVGNEKHEAVNKIRKQLEMMLFKESIKDMSDWTNYKKDLVRLNATVAQQIIKKLEE